MRVAISVPEQVCRAADRVARRLRIPRSQLYTRAMEEYLKRQPQPQITERLTAVYGKRGVKPDAAFLEQGLETLRREDGVKIVPAGRYRKGRMVVERLKRAAWNRKLTTDRLIAMTRGDER